MLSSLSDALSTLSDRGLRRLLGARTFLRGLDYARRKVVEGVDVGEMIATGRVRGSDAEPYVVNVELSLREFNRIAPVLLLQKQVNTANTWRHCSLPFVIRRAAPCREGPLLPHPNPLPHYLPRKERCAVVTNDDVLPPFMFCLPNSVRYPNRMPWRAPPVSGLGYLQENKQALDPSNTGSTFDKEP